MEQVNNYFTYIVFMTMTNIIYLGSDSFALNSGTPHAALFL